jgi:hypothetical protein
MFSEQKDTPEDLLFHLLNPAPLIKDYNYWCDASRERLVLCTPKTKAPLTIDNLLDSGLELMGNFRLLQEMEKQQIHCIAPMGLTVSMEWLGEPALPDMLNRLLKLSQDSVRLMLHVKANRLTSIPRNLLANITQLRLKGVKLVLDYDLAESSLPELAILCDGIRYPLSRLHQMPDVRDRILLYRQEGKVIQITGVAGESDLKLATQCGGDHFLMNSA